jgi:hypothetical protein
MGRVCDLAAKELTVLFPYSLKAQHNDFEKWDNEQYKHSIMMVLEGEHETT